MSVTDISQLIRDKKIKLTLSEGDDLDNSVSFYENGSNLTQETINSSLRVLQRLERGTKFFIISPIVERVEFQSIIDHIKYISGGTVILGPNWLNFHNETVILDNVKDFTFTSGVTKTGRITNGGFLIKNSDNLNTTTNVKFDGIIFSSNNETKYGICLENIKDENKLVTIINCSFTGYKIGMKIRRSEYLKIQDSIFTDNKISIHSYLSNENSFNNLTIKSNTLNPYVNQTENQTENILRTDIEMGQLLTDNPKISGIIFGYSKIKDIPISDVIDNRISGGVNNIIANCTFKYLTEGVEVYRSSEKQGTSRSIGNPEESGNKFSNNKFISIHRTSVYFQFCDSDRLTNNIFENSGKYSTGVNTTVLIENSVGIKLTSNTFTNIYSNNSVYLMNSNDNNLVSNTLKISDNEYLNKFSGIILRNSNNCKINQNTISSLRFGIDLSGTDNNVISGNTFNSNDYSIFTENTDRIITSNNTIDSGFIGISHNICRDVQSSNNTISGLTETGIYLNICQGRVNENIMTDNKNGIYFTNCQNMTLVSNEISKSTEYGLKIISSTLSRILENTLDKNVLGNLYVEKSSDNKFSGTISKNSMNKGIFLVDSNNNTFTNNILTKNIISGIYLLNSNSNKFESITVKESSFGIILRNSTENIFKSNTVTKSLIFTIYIYGSDQNYLWFNDFSKNESGGIYITKKSINNHIYNNQLTGIPKFVLHSTTSTTDPTDDSVNNWFVYNTRDVDSEIKSTNKITSVMKKYLTEDDFVHYVSECMKDKTVPGVDTMLSNINKIDLDEKKNILIDYHISKNQSKFDIETSLYLNEISPFGNLQ